ncbi:galactose mutarotase [Subsaximicrobium wynnwilliamsii]|uniref:Aldose 1-epimerase n=1 Tax=Subsaximicrobium wynnwilliamsii TaxID=291179 RepID=A0A5C6ZJ69_9FLAO|nr:aldose epimerase family protein [Subsaximicrobium wynnwilliamsii]TXD84195.1 galactose mutarotase [Subsaximicrobium wynnwilliamsii]TXD89816.1 galactose mutarotase [Subsaximicrobium wynnwilliamsii]TXE03907.1 galactose mutarotase [Subsaximicrobium wynnwilliamsii]
MSTLKTAIITNRNGMELHVSNFGASILSLKVPNKNDGLTEVVVGLSSPLDYLKEDYLEQNRCLGSSIGRYAGRISKGGFTIDDTFYELSQRNGHHLHGGFKGFDKRYWHFEEVIRDENPMMTLTYHSEDGEEGYPGNLQVSVSYQLTETNALIITYKATTDQPTHVNLTSHAYFNLNGEGSVLEHQLQVQSDRYLEVDEHTIPTGKELYSLETNRSRMELSKLGRDDFSGYDDTFILTAEEASTTLISEETGIKMTVGTNQPVLVIFTPKAFSNLSFKEGLTYTDYPAICFEAQNYPDAPNNIHFPSSLLLPSETYENRTVFGFTLEGSEF